MRTLRTLHHVALLLVAACASESPPAAHPGYDGGTGAVDGARPVDAGVASVDDASAPTRDGATPPTPGCEPACAVGAVCREGRCEEGLTGVAGIDEVLLGDPMRFDNEVLISQDPDLSWRPSRIYKWRDFAQAVATMHDRGIGEMRLYLGDGDASDARRTQQALVNLAAFLAQAMKETIRYDACDENNWDATSQYAISNACGQLGQDYAGYDCEMACPRDPTMAATAVTHATWYGAPGPLFCAPDATLVAAGLMRDGRTGRWDYGHDCWPYPATEAGFSASDGPAWSRPDCEVYAGQRAGRYVWDGSGGSVEGCCWWGRGVIQTTGRCNFGTLNHFLGRSHLDPARFPRPEGALYPDLDFCADPESICASTAHPELKWIAGLFYWMSSVETYDREGWRYLDALRAFVDGGLRDDGFIDAVSGIVNRGCHNPPCATGPVDGLEDRRETFDLVLRTMGLR
ncbi:MAG: hypothetical protein KF901_31805 [Myxococcales bacterium]|nr:hypothetical protein [Myxococcales bacterium]